ncbi:MAG: AMP-binding protein [Bradymonadaceae bacterium]
MRNFATHFWTRFQEAKDTTAFISPGEKGLEEETYWEWTRRVQRLALGLMDAGLKPGTRLGMVAPNSQSWLDLSAAGWLVGACIVPLVPDRDRRETLRCLARSGCDWIVIRDSQARHALRGQANLPDHLRWVVLEGADEDVAGLFTFQRLEESGRVKARRGGVNELARRIYDLEPELPALILFDPEPGEDPQGATYSGNKLAEMLAHLSASASFSEQSRVAVIMNYGWLSAALFTFAALLSGKTLLMAQSLSELAGNLKTLRPTHLVCGPAFLEGQAARWLDRIEKAPEFVRRLTEGGQEGGSQTLNRALGLIGERAAQTLVYGPMMDDFGGKLEAIYVFEGPVPDEVFEILENTNVEVLGHWGLPECGVSHMEHRGARRRGSVGRPVEGYACKILGAKGGEEGEVLIRSDVLFDGYWAGDGPRRIEDGWLHTGVRGRIESGYLFICAR